MKRGYSRCRANSGSACRGVAACRRHCPSPRPRTLPRRSGTRQRWAGLARVDRLQVRGSGANRRAELDVRGPPRGVLRRKVGRQHAGTRQRLGSEIGFEERPRLVLALDAHREGALTLVGAPPGWGKTVLGFHAAAAIGRKTLVITTKDDIYKQWYDGAKTFLGLEH